MRRRSPGDAGADHRAAHPHAGARDAGAERNARGNRPGADDDASEAFSPAAPARRERTTGELLDEMAAGLPASPPIRDRDLPNTTEVGEQAALDTYRRDDWDSKGTVSLYIPEREARQMLMARGFTYAGAQGGWTSPAGHHYWELQEALQIALVAEVA